MRISDWSPDVCSSDLSMFDVEMTGDGARIYVAKGDIAVAELSGRSLSELIPLKAGEAVNVRDGRLERTTIEPREARWPASRLGFEETPLATIIALANRGAGPDITLRDETIGTIRVTGVSSEERLVGEECASTGSSRWSPGPKK